MSLHFTSGYQIVGEDSLGNSVVRAIALTTNANDQVANPITRPPTSTNSMAEPPNLAICA